MMRSGFRNLHLSRPYYLDNEYEAVCSGYAARVMMPSKGRTMSLINNAIKSIKRYPLETAVFFLVSISLAFGGFVIVSTKATTLFARADANTASISGGAQIISNSTAANGKAIQFAGSAITVPSPTPAPSLPAKAWFAPYVDITSWPIYAVEQLGATPNKLAVISFITPSSSNPCTPTWGGYYTLDTAARDLNLDTRISQLRSQGGNVTVSFGGAVNSELAVACTNQASLAQAYSSVINRYQLKTIDLDLENAGLNDQAAGDRRAKALADVQTAMASKNQHLDIWVTLPVTPAGLEREGTNAIATLLRNKVNLAGVNIMAMDYGSSRAAGQSVLNASTSALDSTQKQVIALYQQAGISLSSEAAWLKMGITPMIGQADVQGEVFTLDDAKNLNAYAQSHKIGRMSMWSANRDVACSGGPSGTASSSCSGISQNKAAFSATLGAGYANSLK